MILAFRGQTVIRGHLVDGSGTGAGAASPTPTSASPEEPPGLLETVWTIDDFSGAIRVVEVADGAMFLAGSRPSGWVLYKADLETAEIECAVEEIEFVVDDLATDRDGGVVAVAAARPGAERLRGAVHRQ